MPHEKYHTHSNFLWFFFLFICTRSSEQICKSKYGITESRAFMIDWFSAVFFPSENISFKYRESPFPMKGRPKVNIKYLHTVSRFETTCIEQKFLKISGSATHRLGGYHNMTWSQCNNCNVCPAEQLHYLWPATRKCPVHPGFVVHMVYKISYCLQPINELDKYLRELLQQI